MSCTQMFGMRRVAFVQNIFGHVYRRVIQSWGHGKNWELQGRLGFAVLHWPKNPSHALYI